MRFSDGGSDPVSLGEGKAIRETDKAILVALESGEQKWLPKSQIHDDSEVWSEEQSGDVVVKRWFAEKEGLV